MSKTSSLLPQLIGLGLFVVASAQADIPVPESCTNIVAVAIGTQPPYSNEQGTGLDAQLSQELTQYAGIKVKLQQTDSYADAVQAFSSGQVDMWMSARMSLLEHADALLIEPAYWQADYQLWFRHAELTSLKNMPELRGLRPAYWSAQIKQGLLTPWLGDLLLENGLEVASRREAVQAVLAGTADFLLADKYELALDLHAVEAQDALEALDEIRVTEPIYIALSNNSACNDVVMQKKLSQAVQELNRLNLAKKLLQKSQASLKP